MLSNTLQEDPSKLEVATYEPKMTRAKMKQVLANEGNVRCFAVNFDTIETSDL